MLRAVDGEVVRGSNLTILRTENECEEPSSMISPRDAMEAAIRREVSNPFSMAIEGLCLTSEISEHG